MSRSCSPGLVLGTHTSQSGGVVVAICTVAFNLILLPMANDPAGIFSV